ncbi:furin-like protease 1 isoform X1 [Drosophila innubila]|uniref:furin-like protease 1 isoform X1 n=2 Tax=Drosophila innubila TaxID=198719 RepID=UPI00148C973D|nr:furin-like protease 1 isoform X1 [Drosophila innubila]XP_034484343.1 furin-like protease 1 isoform X1 [Drosophila innubila]XP_034484344.1 furin-like protease 1 isoform X1 [Drosophila innubila]
MKNDVVRWSRQPNSNNISNNKSNSTKHSQRKRNAQLNQHVASKRTCQPKATLVAETMWQQQQQQQTIIECDITTNLNFDCNLFKTRFLTQRNKTKCNRSRHSKTLTATATSTSASTTLLLILQLSFVVFLCNINIGFAVASVAPKVETGHAQSPLLPPYVLDYETSSGSSSSAQLTANSGRSSGAGGDSGHYTHTWAVHIPNGDNNGIVDAVAKEHGFVNLGKIFDDHYHFAHHKVSKRSLQPASHHQTRLDLDERVHWAKQQRAKSRSKRDFISMRPSRTSSRVMSRMDSVAFDDPKWSQMWYLNRGSGLDMNVIPAWKQGITGKGVVVTILDDGLESDHPDIEQNYDPRASYDVNSHDDDPMPHYDLTDSNRHGTRCAGEVAATANNTFCAVGIAYGASVGGVRMLDGDVTDAVEARSLSLNPQHIDIYSASWGPDDDGKTVDGPGELASRAFIEGTTKGRGGKGSIFIWASGNGGREMDNCNCDGYTNSIWTLSISSATEEGHVPWYSEKCSSTLATTYSSGGQSEKQVVTTDLHHSCTVSHTGTSASAPLAAGIAALVLQSNQNLTWRDLQHIVVRTAKPANLRDSTWSRNGVGRRVSHSFGYGLMDAAEMVQVARNWKAVPEQQRCEINAPHVDKVIPPRTHITLQLTVNHCLSVNYLEHVQAKITLTSQRRGDIQLYLKSPANTKVTLLTSRIHDNSRSGFNQWPFMSVHTWGESPHGNWQLEIHNEGRYMAQITQWDMILYGTDTPAQPDDEAHANQPSQFQLYGDEMAHNDIEHDASGQWRNMQQVGEVGVTQDRRNSAACLKWNDQKCLECRESSYFYKDFCYDECPQRTYAKVNTDILDEFDADNELGTLEASSSPDSTNELPSNGSGLIDKDDPLQASERRRRTESTLKPSSILSLTPQHNQICASCDPSCLRCYGPNVSQCSTCPPGSQLRKLSQTNETYCYAYVVRSTIDGSNLSDNEQQEGNYKMQYMQWTTALLVIAVIVSLVGVAVAGAMIYHRQATKDESYTRVSLMAEDESDEDHEVDIFTARTKSPFDVVEYHDYWPREPSEVLDPNDHSNANEEKLTHS